MIPGDIVQTFGDPVRLKTPMGQARLIKKLGDINKNIEN